MKLGVKIRRVIPLDRVDVNFDYSLMPLLPARGEPIPGTDYIGGVHQSKASHICRMECIPRFFPVVVHIGMHRCY